VTPAVKETPPPAWELARLSLLHPAQIAVVEAFEWTRQPMSVGLLFDVFGRQPKFATVS
jgi:hypothetical protein